MQIYLWKYSNEWFYDILQTESYRKQQQEFDKGNAIAGIVVLKNSRNVPGHSGPIRKKF